MLTISTREVTMFKNIAMPNGIISQWGDNVLISTCINCEDELIKVGADEWVHSHTRMVDCYPTDEEIAEANDEKM